MKRVAILSAMTAIALLFSTLQAQEVAIIKFVVYGIDDNFPEPYVDSKRVYHDSVLQYKIRYDDHFLKYDSISYNYQGDVCIATEYSTDEAPARFECSGTDTISRSSRRHPAIDCFRDRYGLIDDYLQDISGLIASPAHVSASLVLGDEYIHYHTFDKAHFDRVVCYGGIQPERDTLLAYECHTTVVSQRLISDSFTFDKRTVTRHFYYTPGGNLSQVTIELCENKTRYKSIWIEQYQPMLLHDGTMEPFTGYWEPQHIIISNTSRHNKRPSRRQ